MIRKRYLITILLSLTLISSMKFIGSLLNNQSIDYINQDNEQLKSSGFWELSPFIINDFPLTGGDYAWEEAALQPWCNGSGTWNDPYLIENITIDAGGSGSCLEIWYSNKYFIIKNSTFTNAGTDGIRLVQVRNGTLQNNTFVDNYWGIQITSSSYNNTVYKNILIDNTMGISVGGGWGNKIINNTLTNSQHISISIDTSFNNSIIGNKIIDNLKSIFDLPAAISITLSHHIRIIDNTIINGLPDGVKLIYSDYNLIKNNTCTYNENGIYFDDSNYNNVTANRLNNNTNDGIYLYDSDNNTFSENSLRNNKKYGVNIDSNYLINDYSIDNILYNNTFIGNGKNARDWGGSSTIRYNEWDFTKIGNFWDNYSGVDNNDDGIGDSPYSIKCNWGESYDFWPIWWDSLQVVINSPNVNDTFESSPSFNISVNRGIVNTSWYTLNNGMTNITFTGLNGVIDKEEWNEKGVGPVSITFWVNDSKGYLSSEAVQVIKYYDTPQISIISPNMSQIFGANAPDFVITINDLSSINSTWYTIDGGLTNFTFFGFEGSINQTAWNDIENGPLTVRFYANDTLGFEGYTDVTLQKDIIPPTSMIYFTPFLSPNIVNQTTALYITADDGNGCGVLFIRYKINDSSWIDYTSPFVLSSYAYGDYNITYQAIDTVGNIEFEKSIIITLVEIPSETNRSTIPGYIVPLLMASICVVITIKIKKKLILN